MSEMNVPEVIYAVIDGDGLVRFASTIKQVCHDHINNFAADYTEFTNEVSEEEISGEIDSWVVRGYEMLEQNNLLIK
jgi:hypothetical protein